MLFVKMRSLVNQFSVLAVVSFIRRTSSCRVVIMYNVHVSLFSLAVWSCTATIMWFCSMCLFFSGAQVKRAGLLSYVSIFANVSTVSMVFFLCFYTICSQWKIAIAWIKMLEQIRSKEFSIQLKRKKSGQWRSMNARWELNSSYLNERSIGIN